MYSTVLYGGKFRPILPSLIKVMPTLRQCAEDKSWRVRYMVADKFTELQVIFVLVFNTAGGCWLLLLLLIADCWLLLLIKLIAFYSSCY